MSTNPDPKFQNWTWTKETSVDSGPSCKMSKKTVSFGHNFTHQEFQIVGTAH